MKLFAPITLSLALLFLSACVSLPAKVSPMARLVYGGGFNQHTIELFPDSIVEEAHDTNSDKVLNRKKVPLAAGEAEKIVNALLAQGVGDWLTDYGTSDGILPGPEPDTTFETGQIGSWRLTIQHRGHSTVSSGRGMFPSDANPKKAVEMNVSNRYERMVAVFHSAMDQRSAR